MGTWFSGQEKEEKEEKKVKKEMKSVSAECLVEALHESSKLNPKYALLAQAK
jgi:hypothetical protein